MNIHRGNRLTALLLLFAGVQVSAGAQAPLTNACQTQFGVCFTQLAPVGAPCMCGPGGPAHQGRMIFTAPPPVQMQAPPPQLPASIACGTRFGVCQMPFPAPVGTPCSCGTDPGQIIMFR